MDTVCVSVLASRRGRQWMVTSGCAADTVTAGILETGTYARPFASTVSRTATVCDSSAPSMPSSSRRSTFPSSSTYATLAATSAASTFS